MRAVLALCLPLLLAACGVDRQNRCVLEGGKPSRVAPQYRLDEAVKLGRGRPPPAAPRAPRPDDVDLDPLAGESEPVRLAASDIGPGNTIGRAAERLADRLRERGPENRPVRVLALSTGGAWGAFGVGLLDGLRARARAEGRAPDDAWREYDVVTGVSTGAMLAPLVYLGRERDFAVLRDRYTSLTDREVLRRRLPVEYLWAPSLFSTAPLRDLLERIVTDALVADIADEWRNTSRVLAVLAVNLDTADARVFDLGAIAAGEGGYEAPRDRRKAIIDAVMAAAAIPIGFTPVTIAGCAYTDGGVRQHIFVASEVAVAVSRALRWRVVDTPAPEPGGPRGYAVFPREADKRPHPAEIHILVNGDRRLARGDTRLGLVPIARRVLAIVTDEGLDASAFRLAAISQDLGWRVGQVDASPVTRYKNDPERPRGPGGAPRPCDVPVGDDALFDPVFTRCLYEGGQAMGGRGPGIWSDAPPPAVPFFAPSRPRADGVPKAGG